MKEHAFLSMALDSYLVPRVKSFILRPPCCYGRSPRNFRQANNSIFPNLFSFHLRGNNTSLILLFLLTLQSAGTWRRVYSPPSLISLFSTTLMKQTAAHSTEHLNTRPLMVLWWITRSLHTLNDLAPVVTSNWPCNLTSFVTACLVSQPLLAHPQSLLAQTNSSSH
jgi:hypothetical protein